jgi:NAD(P)-dependent dehydrogenase (short-subunit alcohol dehydrogenase family)
MSMTHDLPRVAAITGAAGGIGAATVAAFAAGGYTVVALDRTEAVLPAGAGGLALTCDLAAESDVAGVFARIGAAFGRLDVLVNVAGINHRAGVREMRLEDWNRMLDVNVGAMFLTAKHALPLLQHGEAPAIVNMSSISGHVASADYPAYVTTKAAVESLTWALAGEVAGRGIRVNAVAPGWVNAGFTQAARETAEDPAALDAAAARAHVLGRMAEPAEIAAAILWLASPKASFVTGERLFVDGGLMRVH